MRLFVALTPPADILAEIERATAPLRDGTPSPAPAAPAGPRLRWVGRDAMHVTLAFLGEVPDDRVTGLSVRLERAAGRHQRTALCVIGAGAFPAAAKARVLFARIGGRPDQLAALRALAGSVAAGARRAGAPPPGEGRRFRPHLTLARSSLPADLGPLIAALAGFSSSEWNADRIDLIRSYTGPRPRYETLGSWPLRPD